MKSKWKKYALPFVVSSSLLLTACNSASSTDAKPDLSKIDTDPLGKYETPITLTTARSTNSSFKFVEGDDHKNNMWTRYIEEKLGIKTDYKWIVDDSQYQEKLSVTIASGEIPDLLYVDQSQLSRLVKSKMTADMTEIFDKVASDQLKEIYNQDGGKALDSAKFDGKLLAIPRVSAALTDQGYIVWIREDWLKKLNLEGPKTMDDLMKISKAFTENDPDGDGKDDTYGLAISKDLWDGYGGATGFFNGYHAYPNIWTKNDKGKLEYGSVQPEIKDALSALNKMYKEGQIDPEFGVKDGSKVSEDLAAGKIGIQYGKTWNPAFPLNTSHEADGAMWKPYPIVSADSEPARPQQSNVAFGYYAVSKDAKNPEALIKLLNLYAETVWGPNSEKTKDFRYDKKNQISTFDYGPVTVEPPLWTIENHLDLKDAIVQKDPSNLKWISKDSYEAQMKYLEGDDSQWAEYMINSPEGAYSVINKYIEEDLYLVNEFTGAPTKTMGKKLTTLENMWKEMALNVIMGKQSPEDFDKFVKDWEKLGGSDMTKEVNEWKDQQK
ncbi:MULTISPECIES: extracellular solute-binding protein [Metabacillus]|uniref:extracellular solute-binding protein n=1 Tax=Metabacillus TaxID=2675233 RepID=UPI001939739A|nr:MULTISPECIES: extracellular solute-binding protein [Metabacillus]